MVVPKMIFLWGFRVVGILIWGEELIRMRERDEKKSFVFN